MKLLALLAFVAIAFATNVAEIESDVEKWSTFQAKFRKNYATPEERLKRFAIFRENIRIAAELQSKDSRTFFGVTQFMDLTREEFKKFYLIQNFTSPKKQGKPVKVWKPTTAAPQAYPTSYDWRTKGAVTPVYNQGQCGSCWAFSVTENIESMAFLSSGSLRQLSMQELVSCDTEDYGCGGGNPPNAYDWIINDAGGMESYADYPYSSGNGYSGTCSFNSGDIVQKISNWQYITQNDDESAMQSFVYNNGPPSICVDASTWQYYTGVL
jgi:C1A family cysteine protease